MAGNLRSRLEEKVVLQCVANLTLDYLESKNQRFLLLRVSLDGKIDFFLIFGKSENIGFTTKN